MEMVRRAVARPDLDAVPGKKRIRHVALGGAHRLAQAKPLGETGGDCRGKRAAGTVGIFRRDPVGSEAGEYVGPDQKIDALGVAAMTALDENRLRPQRKQALTLLTHLRLVAGSRGLEQRRRFRQIRRDNERTRYECTFEHIDRVRGEKL